MSTTDEIRLMMTPERAAELPRAGVGSEAGDIKLILNGIADHIADADRRHSAVLADMQQRLAILTSRAQGMRERLPGGMSLELDRIEASMAQLSAKLAVADKVTTVETQPVKPVFFNARPLDPQASPHAVAAVMAAGAATTDSTGVHVEPPAAIKTVSSDGLGSLTRRDEAGRNAGKSEVDRFDVVDFDEPWDASSAEALTSLYETSDASLLDKSATLAGEKPVVEAATNAPSRADVPPAVGQGQAVPGTGTGTAKVGVVEDERAWLEGRFADIAARLDKSLEHMRHDDAVGAFGDRFAKLEESIAAAMVGAVTRDDLTALSSIESQVEDLTAQLVTVQTHFSRLDTIELELRALSERISEEKLVKLFEEHAPQAPDVSDVVHQVSNRLSQRMPGIEKALETIAERVSEENLTAMIGRLGARQTSPDDVARLVAAQLAPQLAHAGGVDGASTERLDELRALVNEFAAERRHGDEQTNTMLDTMQQAMIRLLDRMDALETSQIANEAAEDDYAEYGRQSEAGSLATLEREPISYRRQVNGPDIPVDDFGDEPPVAAERRRDASGSGAVSTIGAGVAGAGLRLPGSELPPRAMPRTDLDDGKVGTSGIGGGGKGATATTSDAASGSAAVSREDFIAAARRAARQAAAAPPEEVQPGANVPEARPVEEVGARKPRQKARTTRSPSRLTVALLCLLAVGTGFVAFGTPLLSGATHSVQRPVAQQPTGGKTEAGRTKASTAPGGAGSGAASDLIDADEEARGKSSAAPDRVPSFGGPKALIAPAGSSAGGPAARSQAGTQSASSVPSGHGLPAIDGATALANATELPSGPIGSIYGNVAHGGGATPVPAALTPDHSIVGTAANGAKPGSAAAGRSALPPARIGPYSLRHAAASGRASAQFEIAARFAEGRGVQQNLKEAVVWYQKAASQGFAPAQYRLASMYERGFGVQADLERARIWYQRAAEQGVVKAMHNLAVLSSGRGGTEPNYTVATRWFTEAAEHGLIDSQFNLAIMHDSGLGVARDPAVAFKWFSIASRKGDAEAAKRRASLRAKLTLSQVQALEAEIEAWRPRVPGTSVNDMRVAGEAWKRKAE